MSKSTLLFLLIFGSMSAFGQNIFLTFTGTGAATQIDSVTATNLRTNESVTLPGNETLVLTLNTGIPSVSELQNRGMVFPNPFSGNATFTTVVQKPQTVYLKVQNLVGQVIAQTEAFVQPGENEFTLSVNAAGIYTVSLTTYDGTAGYKVICTEAGTSQNRIQYLGSGSNNHNNQNNHNNPLHSGLKSFQTTYLLGYSIDDLILYLFRSGQFYLRLVEKPTISKKIEASFVACTDLDGKSYPVVKIGNQTWMAQNLAYLPGVSGSLAGSETSPFYYVYGYEGTSVSAAKATVKYDTYGVLYNWAAAKTACPAGWHLPADVEVTTLTDYLGGLSVAAGKMKETGITHWTSPNTSATNASGFTALPGGYRYYGGGFSYLFSYAYFWSASEFAASTAWSRYLHFLNAGATRVYDLKSYGYSVRCLRN